MARASTPKVSYAAAQYVAHRYAQSKSEPTRRNLQGLLNRLSVRVKDCHTGSLRAEHIEDFFYGPGGLHEGKKGDRLAPTTLAAYRGWTKSFLHFCDRRGWLTVPVGQLVEGLPDRNTQTNRNRYRMTRAEIRRLLEAAQTPRDRALVAFVANTGLRISEALHMRVRDVSFGKGELYVYLPKAKEEVTIPLSLDLEDELRIWLTRYTENVGEVKRSHFLFPAFFGSQFQRGKHRWNTGRTKLNPEGQISNPQQIIKRVADAAGIELEPGDAWHTIRRSFARILYDDAVSLGHDAALRIVQAALNHKQVSTTERYLGLNLERQTYAAMMKGKRFLTADVEPGKIVDLDERRMGRG